MSSEDTSEVIDSLIRQDRSFAIYRIPGEKHPRFVMQSAGSARLLYSIEELNGQTGFVIAPFRVTPDCPIVLIRRDVDQLKMENGELKMGKTLPPSSSNIQFSIFNSQLKHYSECFNSFIKPLQEKKLDKLVLSRSLTQNRLSDFSPAKAFYKACQQYTRSYVYLCHTPQTGTWIGGTPEIILSGEKGAWNTVALAGTQPLQNGELPTYWDEKNKREQQIVATYIHDQLSSLGIDSVMEGPYSARAGALCHLKSDFKFTLRENNKLGDLLNLLHPTPAVCGLPKADAYRFILDHEGYDRRYYSGFIGWLNPEGRTDLYVNLRCMHIEDKILTLYAGGGLLSSSELNDEWQETEDKLQTMKALL